MTLNAKDELTGDFTKMNTISPSHKLVLNSFHLFATTIFLHFYEETSSLNDKLCTALANDMFKNCKTHKSNHGRILSAQETLIKYVRSVIEKSELGSQIDREFILKCIAHDTAKYKTFLFSLVQRVVDEVTRRPDWSYRKIVNAFGAYIHGLAELADQDIMNFEDEAAKVMMREMEEVARYSLLKFVTEQEKKNASQPA